MYDVHQEDRAVESHVCKSICGAWHVMLKYAAPLVKHYKKVVWNPKTPGRIRNILKDGSEKPLKDSDCNSLVSYFMGQQPDHLTSGERNYLLRYLYQKEAYKGLETIGRKFLYADQQKSIIREDVSLPELKRYLHSIAKSKKTLQLDVVVEKVIAQFSLAKKDFVVRVINLAFALLCEICPKDSEEPLIKWTKWTRMLNGHCEFTDYVQYRYILNSMLTYLRGRQDKKGEFYSSVLDSVRTIQGAAAASQFASTLIYLLAYTRNFQTVEAMWQYKIKNGFSIARADLTNIMKTYCHFEKYALVTQVYQEHSEAQQDVLQFDYLLIAHAKLQSWKSLQDQFNALFNVGDLPNLHHYGIVMHSLASIGELESVEKLYGQLLRRKMLPSYAVLQSLLLVHYKSADLAGCFTHFQLFEKYSVQPSSSTYTIMLKAYRNLNDIEGALRLLKRMTESGSDIITESHFAILIHMCSKITNNLIAQELLQLMMGHYNIRPTGLSISALMDVYIACGIPQEALRLFKKYAKSEPVPERLISVYNKAIIANIQMNDKAACEKLFEQITTLQLTTNEEFYRVIIKYLVNMEKDYEAAEGILDQLITHPSLQADASHFECLMKAYDDISFRPGVVKLYEKLTVNKIPISSNVLYYLVKSVFKIQIRHQENFDHCISLLNNIMENVAHRNLNMNFQFLHPSVLGWAMRAVAKYRDPQEALQLLHRYNTLFYGQNESEVNNRFVILRSLLVLTGEIQQWDDFEHLFDKYVARIQRFQNLPSATVKNKRLSTLMTGLFTYKVKHLFSTGRINQIPEWLDKMNSMGMILDNKSWNEAVACMFKDSRTIERGLRIANDNLIHGFNLIHKYRLLRKHSKDLSSTDPMPWLLQQKKLHPASFRPMLYLQSDVALRTMESMDEYLNCFADVSNKLKELLQKYPYYMKNYVMHPRPGVNHWDEVEHKHAEYLGKLRSTKRVIPVSEFEA